MLLWLRLEDEDTQSVVQFLKDVANFCEEGLSLADWKKVNLMGGIADLKIAQMPVFD